MEDARERILNSAKAIFLEQGYKKTTIRQIVRRSGLLIGSIYHFFKNKEDIFRQLFLRIFEQCEELIQHRFGADADPAFRLVLMCATMLEAAGRSANIRELYCELLSLPETAELHTLHFERWIAQQLGRSADDGEAFAKALVINSVLYGLLASHDYSRRLPIGREVGIMTDTILGALQLDAPRAEEVRRRLRLLPDGELVAIAEELAEHSLA